MKEYIEREAATTIPPLPKEFRSYQTFNLDDAFDDGWYEAQRCIANLPAADVKPVVRGKWLPKNETGDCCYQCSDCGFVRDAYILDIGNFCPNCGSYNGGDGDDQH